MAIAKIKTGDLVEVITGKDKGKRGKVVRVVDGGARLVVEGVNSMKRTIKPRYQGETGQTVDFNAPVSISNVMLYDETSKKRTRVGIKEVGGSRVRIAKQTGNEI